MTCNCEDKGSQYSYKWHPDEGYFSIKTAGIEDNCSYYYDTAKEFKLEKISIESDCIIDGVFVKGGTVYE